MKYSWLLCANYYLSDVTYENINRHLEADKNKQGHAKVLGHNIVILITSKYRIVQTVSSYEKNA